MTNMAELGVWTSRRWGTIVEFPIL